jgi:hypothetical protein
MVFLERLYSPLLLAHLFAVFVLIGSMSHSLLIVLGYVRGKFARQELEWFYVKVSLCAYAVVYTIGAVIYPAYKIYINTRYFDAKLPWTNGLFETKEHWGAVGLGLFVAYYFLRRSFQPAEERSKLFLYVPVCVLLNVIVWYIIVAGSYLTLLKGSW